MSGSADWYETVLNTELEEPDTLSQSSYPAAPESMSQEVEQFRTMLACSSSVDSEVPLQIWDPDAPPYTVLRLFRKPRIEVQEGRPGEDVVREFDQIDPDDWYVDDLEVALDQEADTTVTYTAELTFKHDQIVGGTEQPKTTTVQYTGEIPVEQYT